MNEQPLLLMVVTFQYKTSKSHRWEVDSILLHVPNKVTKKSEFMTVRDTIANAVAGKIRENSGVLGVTPEIHILNTEYYENDDQLTKD